MSLAYIEYRSLSDGQTAANDIALHFCSRRTFGKALVITTQPEELKIAIYKQWIRHARRLSSERINEDAASRMIALSKQMTQMQQVQFTTEPPSDRPQADIFLVTPDSLDDLLPVFATLYVTCDAPHDLLEAIVEVMPPQSVVVVY
jgi:hypothetical protein